MSYTLGFDSSTQGLSATLLDTKKVEVVAELAVNFGQDLPQYNAPSGFIPGGVDGEVHADPMMWLDALDLLFSRMVEAGWALSEVVSISGSGQQHGSVYLDATFEAVLAGLDAEASLSSQLSPCLTRTTSPIWMDSSTRVECDEIASTIGGDAEVCSLTGSVMIERFTGSQIRKFSKTSAYAETQHIHLVSSFMASVFAGSNAPIDTGDGAGMNLMNLEAQDWDQKMLEATAPNLSSKLPPIAPASSLIGAVSSYFIQKYGLSEDCQVYLWSGDNPCSLVGMGASGAGKVVISLGTSYTLFAGMDQPRTDPNGFGHVFGNPMKGYMSLICFMNGSLAREKVRDERGADWSQFGNDYLDQTPAGNEGRLMLPFYDPEITPLMSLEEVVTNGWSRTDEDVAVEVRACLEGQILNMRLQSEWMGESPTRVLVTGGGSKSPQICQVIADVFGADVARLKNAGSASLGAAMMAAVGAELVSLDTLEQTLCAVDDDTIVSSNADAQVVYEKLLPEFTKMLK